MIHIIVPGKGYFPKNLVNDNENKKRVVILADPDGMIPVSAYLNKDFSNPEVIPVILNNKNGEVSEELTALKIAFMVGQIAGHDRFTVYTDNQMLADAVKCPAQVKKTPARKSSPVTKTDKQLGQEQEAKTEDPEMNPPAEAATAKKKTEKSVAKAEKPKATSTVKKAADIKAPSDQDIKKVIGNGNEKYIPLIRDVFKTSTQVTFALNVRMALAKEGASNEKCREIADNLEKAFKEKLPL